MLAGVDGIMFAKLHDISMNVVLLISTVPRLFPTAFLGIVAAPTRNENVQKRQETSAFARQGMRLDCSVGAIQRGNLVQQNMVAQAHAGSVGA